MKRNLDMMYEELKALKEERSPLPKTLNARIDAIEKEIIEYKLNNKLFEEMSDLQKYSGQELKTIKLVVNHNNKLYVEELSGYKNTLEISDNGTLYYSSFDNGIITNSEGNYYHLLEGQRSKINYVGFFDVEFQEYN